ncbi:MAG: caspase family protein [Alistipes sp.]|nr:caspase family protein [Alistipes sp.]
MKKLYYFKHLLLYAAILTMSVSTAQNIEVEQALKQKYPLVQYHNECGGWYFLGYNTNGEQKYGFADSAGNVVVSEATQYKIYPGYMECYLLDLAQKSIHDQWKVDCKIYEQKYIEYQRIEAKYKADVAAFNAKVEAAEAEATNRWKRAQNAAMERARYEAQKAQSQASGSILGAVLSGVAGVASVAAAAASVKYEPFLNQVLAERDLLVKPSKPYNPRPKKPVEPANGYYWKAFSLRQPCKYEYINFGQITEPGRFADVQHNGKWGLVDSYMREIVPCVNTDKVRSMHYPDNLVLVKHLQKYGVVDKDGKSVVPIVYKTLVRIGERFKAETDKGFGLLDDKGNEIIPCRYTSIDSAYGYWLCNDNGKWGVFTSDYNELYPCQFQAERLMAVGEKLALYNKNKGLWGVIDFYTGVELLPNNYSEVEYVDLGQAGSFYKVCRNGLYGLYTDRGIMVIPCEYSKVHSRTIGAKPMIEVAYAGTVGLYETTGITVIPVKKYRSYKLENNYYKVQSRDGNYGVCDLYGNELIPCKYRSLDYSGRIDGFIASNSSGKGIVSMTGRELFPFVDVSSIELSSVNREALIVSNGTYKGYGAIDYAGRMIVPMKNKSDKVGKKVSAAMKKDTSILSSYNKKRTFIQNDLSSRNNLAVRAQAERGKFSFFAQNYVGRIVNEWQKKGEFEKVDDWRKRVNNNTLNQRVFALTKEAQNIYIGEYEKGLPMDSPRIVGSYDPDHETYRIHTKYSDQDILVHVPSQDALEFKTSFSTMRKVPKFFVENDQVGLAEYQFELPNGAKYKYSNEASLIYSIANVKYNLDAIEIDKNAANGGRRRGKQVISTSNFTIGRSDIDIDIPTGDSKRPNTFAVIIANENYDNEKAVQYAYNDGQALRDYCQRTLGIPEENIHFRPDATYNNMKFEINWLKTVTKTHPNSQVIFYYAGHGMPDDATRESFLLPIDGYSTVSSTGLKLSELYASLGSLSSDNVLVMLDACFTGADRSDQVMANVRGVKIAPRVDRPRGNVIVFTATSNQQTAHPYVEQSHGLFTYYLLKYLQEHPTNITLGEWFNYVRTKVAQKASVVNSKEQTPTAISSSAITNSWKSLKL